MEASSERAYVALVGLLIRNTKSFLQNSHTLCVSHSEAWRFSRYMAILRKRTAKTQTTDALVCTQAPDAPIQYQWTSPTYLWQMLANLPGRCVVGVCAVVFLLLYVFGEIAAGINNRCCCCHREHCQKRGEQYFEGVCRLLEDMSAWLIVY